MKKISFIMCVLILVCSLSACSNNVSDAIYKEPLTLDADVSSNTIPVNKNALLDMDDGEITWLSSVDNDYFSFEYDSNRVEVIDNSNNGMDDNCSYLIKNTKGDPLTSIAHIDIVGIDNVAIPSVFTKSVWEKVARQIVGSYYSESIVELMMSVSDTKISPEHPAFASTNIVVEAIQNVPSINAKVYFQNGIDKSVVIVIMSYADDSADMSSMLEVIDTLHIK